MYILPLNKTKPSLSLTKISKLVELLLRPEGVESTQCILPRVRCGGRKGYVKKGQYSILAECTIATEALVVVGRLKTGWTDRRLHCTYSSHVLCDYFQ